MKRIGYAPVFFWAMGMGIVLMLGLSAVERMTGPAPVAPRDVVISGFMESNQSAAGRARSERGCYEHH
jgi:hypothetical protein